MLPSIELEWLLKECIVNNVDPELVSISIELSHILAYTPPYNSDLQPIELVWAFIKFYFARQYDGKTTMKGAYQNLSTEFDFLVSKEGKSNRKDHEQDGIYSTSFLVRNW